MAITHYVEDPAHPGMCKNCGMTWERDHSGARFAESGDICNSSRAYLWRTARTSELLMVNAAVAVLKDFNLATNAHIRVVDRSATGDDSWAHSYGYDEPYRQNETHAVIMDGWAQQYTTTIREMRTAWEFFEKGWRARDAVPVKVDLKHESEWILLVGTLKIYVSGKGEVPVPHYAAGTSGFHLTPDLAKAHGFRSRREATDCLNQVHNVHSRHIVSVWDPKIAQRANMR